VVNTLESRAAVQRDLDRMEKMIWEQPRKVQGKQMQNPAPGGITHTAALAQGARRQQQKTWGTWWVDSLEKVQ